MLGALAIVCAARPLLERCAGGSRVSSRRRLAARGAVVLVALRGRDRRRRGSARGPERDRARRSRTPAGCRRSRSCPRRASRRCSTGKTAQPDRRRPRRRPAASRRRRSAPRRAGARARGDRRRADRSSRRQIRAAAGGTIDVPAYRLDRMRVWLEPGTARAPRSPSPTLEGTPQLTAYEDGRRRSCAAIRPARSGRRSSSSSTAAAGSSPTCAAAAPVAVVAAPQERAAMRRAAAAGFAGVRLTDVADAGRARLPPGRVPLRRHRTTRRR